jgi:hypothetical protein
MLEVFCPCPQQSAAMSGGFNASRGLPATARAIMNIVPERKVPPLSDKQQQQASGLARAVANLNQHEPRCGSSRWVP